MMSGLEKKKSPSFSSTLLDKIYRSIDEGDGHQTEDRKFYREGTAARRHMAAAIREPLVIPRPLRPRREEKVVDPKAGRRAEFERKSRCYVELDRSLVSSCSSSSDSSSGGFSSSDTDCVRRFPSRAASFPPPRPKSVAANLSALFGERAKPKKKPSVFDESGGFSAAGRPVKLEESLEKSRSRALKIYSNLKKVKQPISPGGRLAGFINSLFATSNAKRSKKQEHDAKAKSAVTSTCSSASSFSRSCLSKNSDSSSKEKSVGRINRTVRFYPVSVIVDEDCQPCGHKSLHESESNLVSVNLPSTWKIGKSSSRKVDDEHKFESIDNSRRPDPARDPRKDNQNQLRGDPATRKLALDYTEIGDEDDEDDDAASCASSDLFELDHHRYMEELPVYETTNVKHNRSLAAVVL